jgi:hypothetical protein
VCVPIGRKKLAVEYWLHDDGVRDYSVVEPRPLRLPSATMSRDGACRASAGTLASDVSVQLGPGSARCEAGMCERSVRKNLAGRRRTRMRSSRWVVRDAGESNEPALRFVP